MPCPIARALDVVGDWWTLLIVRDALIYEQTRFEDIRKHLGITTSVLADRLDRLVENGMLVRTDAPRGRSPHEYLPTDKARALYPVLAGLAAWGEQYVDDPDIFDVPFFHTSCGTQLAGALHCPTCDSAADNQDIHAKAGPRVDRSATA